MEHLNTSYFRNLWAKNVDNLKNLCKEWEGKHSDSSIPEEVRDEIRTTIGLTNLLLSQKLKQFQGLIDDFEFKRGEKEITCLDLQGFWDMVYYEVEKIEKSFSNLEKCQKNNWIFVQENTVKMPNKKKFIPAVVKSSISSKKCISAVQQRLAEAKLKMRQQMAMQKENALKKDTSSAIEDVNSKIFLNKGPHRKDENYIVEKKEETTAELKKSMSGIIINKSNEKQMKHSTKINIPTEQILSSKRKTRNKVIEKNDIENILLQPVTESEKISSNIRKRRGKPKEVIPLQCVTRSATRAMLAIQNEAQKN